MLEGILSWSGSSPVLKDVLLQELEATDEGCGEQMLLIESVLLEEVVYEYCGSGVVWCEHFL